MVESDGTLPPNMTHIFGTFYLVRTQAGLNQAVKHRFDGDNRDLEVEGYPTHYPAIVSIDTNYRGYLYIAISHVHVNVMKRVLEQQGEI